MKTVYIPIKAEDELPEEKTPVFVLDEVGHKHNAFYQEGYWYEAWHEDVIAFPKFWLKEVELPSEEEIEKTASDEAVRVLGVVAKKNRAIRNIQDSLKGLILKCYKEGAQFILNKLK
jgi:hypothetical protein